MSQNVILLVEDQPDDVRLFQFALTSWNVPNPLRVVTTGDEALAYLAGQSLYADRKLYPLPALILLDLSLPQLSGFEVLKWIRSRSEFKQVPIVVLSASEERRDIDHAYELGANSYLIKTPDLNKLFTLIQDLNDFVLAPFNPQSVIQLRDSK
ncbi:MAG: response regulator receiver protein [Pedosphaera sp.]|nr:response regulator receiver protein [Pedosphaera sp.]